LAQTSPAPLALEIVKACGCTLYDAEGKEYTDLIGGISVCNVGHCNNAVVNAVQKQAAQYMHVMVYGETVQQPQVAYAKWLTEHLPTTLNNVYFTNSGTEATEGAMKLAKRVTGKTGFVSCYNSYHGHTQGALSVMGSEYWKQNYRPLLPNCQLAKYNDIEILQLIDNTTAAVIVEPVQAESGVIPAHHDWLLQIREKCNETCTLLIFDEIQSGFGRTGTLWAFEQYGIEPDILLLGKALGGGMPLGAFIASKKMMNTLTEQPVLGHLTTFGGHPVSCAAGLAAADYLMQHNIINRVAEKAALFKQHLQHDKIIQIQGEGLWMSVTLQDEATNFKTIAALLQAGIFTDWFLYNSNSFRIGPPLTITNEEIVRSCRIIVETLNNV
jgi:acetylornithine/succinyldiaminopimelate/putrescine aminotransferase